MSFIQSISIKRQTIKMMIVILMVLCVQIASSIHAHSIDEDSVEPCTVCLVSQNSELDDVIPALIQSKLTVSTEFISSKLEIAQPIHFNSPLVLYLRGPPA